MASAKVKAKFIEPLLLRSAELPDEESGHLPCNLLQNYGKSGTPLLYYAFDLLILAGKNVTGDTLDARRTLLRRILLWKAMKKPCSGNIKMRLTQI